MIYQRGHLARPLDAALSNASRLAVLRVLAGAGELGRSGRATARLAGINHQSAASALDALHALGLVARYASGRSVMWRLDRRRWLVRTVLLPMLDKEADHADAVAATVKGALDGRCRAVLVVGAAAAGKLAPGKPLQLLVVEKGGRRGAAEALRALKATLAEEWALELDARIASAAEAMKAAALDDAWRLLPDEGRGFVSAGR